MTQVFASREMFKPPDRVKANVPLPELGEGVVVSVWAMTAREWTAFQAEHHDSKGRPNAKSKRVRERLVIACCRDESGQPLFTDADSEILGQQLAGTIERIVDKIIAISGLSPVDIESAAKKSDATEGG